MFNELEEVCDRVALIFNGKIVDIANVNNLKNLDYKTFKVEFNKKEEYLKFKKLKFEIVRDQEKYNQVTVKILNGNINKLFKALEKYDLKFISETKYNLEKYFKEILIQQKGGKNV